MTRWSEIIAACLLLLTADPAAGCTLCQTDAGDAPRAGIFNGCGMLVIRSVSKSAAAGHVEST